MPTLDPEEFFWEVADRFFNSYKYADGYNPEDPENPNEYLVIIAKGNAPRPSGKYCLINLVTAPRIGTEDESYDTEEEEINLTEIFEPMISINVFDAYRKAMDFRKYLIKPITIEYADSQEYAIIDVSGLRNLDSINDREFEKRHQFDVRLRVNESVSDPTSSIGKITIDAELDTLKKVYEQEIVIDTIEPEPPDEEEP